MNFEKFQNVLNWYERLKVVKGWSESDSGAKGFAEFFKHLWVEDKRVDNIENSTSE